MDLVDLDQKKAIEHDTGPCLVLAGPGSGKTTTLTTRVRHLIKVRGVPPESIMVITFTRAAAQEMKERFYRMLFDEGDHSRPQVTFGTFHSIFLSIIRTHQDFSDKKILTGKEKLIFMKECAQSLNLLQNERDDSFDFLAGDISKIKNSRNSGVGCSAEERLAGEKQGRSASVALGKCRELDEREPYQPKCGITEEEFFRFFALYEERKKKYGFMDFDDMLTVALDVFRNDKECLRKTQARYSYFLVDEAQDMNELQYESMKLLAGESGNLFLVGDDDQSIYSFRGAEPKILKTFTEDYPDSEVIEIHGNYRCASKIVETSSKLIAVNETRFQKTLESRTGVEGAITMIMHVDENAQDGFVLRHIEKFLGGSDDKSIAVLVRNRAEAYVVMDALKNAGISYYSPFSESAGKGGALSDFIVQDVLAYLRLSCGEEGEGYKRADILKVMNKPDRRLPRYGLEKEFVTGEEWLSYFDGDRATADRIRDFMRSLELLKSFSPQTALKFILNGMGYYAVIEQFLKEHPLKKNEVNTILKELETLSESVRRNDDLITAIEKHYAEKKAREAQISADERIKNARVFIYTYHGAKGLQFDEVLLLSVNDTIVPSKNAVTKEAVEEERRMFYVAMTRAKEKIVFSCVKKHGKDYLPPSRFLYEMKDNNH